MIQDPTNVSSSFPSVEVSEIGLRSASMDCGGLPFLPPNQQHQSTGGTRRKEKYGNWKN